MGSYTVKRFDGNTIQSSSYRSALISDPLPAAQNVYLAQAQADSQDSGAFTVDVRNVALAIEVLDYANRKTLEDQLKIWFKRGTRGNLEATFLDDSSDYLLECSVVSITQDKDFPQFWTIVFQTGMTNWRAVTASTDTWTPSGTSGSKTITVGGKDQTKLSLSITTTALPTNGYLKRDTYRLVNVPGVHWGKHAWCMTVDTLALVAQDAHKCQINNGAGIDAVQTTIPYDTVTGTVPTAGYGYCGTEQISWTGRTGTTSGNLTGCTRGVNGTTAAAHADDAPIKVSLVQADLNDWRIWMNDKETKRWIDSPCTTTTKIWFNVNIGVGFALTLATAIADSGTPAYIQFTKYTTHQTAINSMPSSGVVYHGNEWFLYSGKNVEECRLTLSKRGYLNTTVEAHGAGVVFYFIENPITVTYCNFAATDPSLDDDHYDDDKPIFDLHESDNTKRVYTASTLFYDPDHPNRPGSMFPFVRKTGPDSKVYHIKGDASSGDAAMGVKVSKWRQRLVWKGENVEMGFWLPKAGGDYDKISIAGRKYRTGTTWPRKVGLYASRNQTSFNYVFEEATPPTASSYSTFTHTEVSLPSQTKYLRFGVFDYYENNRTGEEYMLVEVTSMTTWFKTTHLPSAALLGVADNVTLDVEISNTANGDAIKIKMPVIYGLPLALDGETNIATFDSNSAYGAITLDDDSRVEFIRLEPGSNPLSITSEGMGTQSIALIWYKRRP